jgi:hypothetical protein
MIVCMVSSRVHWSRSRAVGGVAAPRRPGLIFRLYTVLCQ